jgi:predicted HicB family RNase H-like nuclease
MSPRTSSTISRETLVVVSTRIPRSLRRRVRLEAVRDGVSMERFIADALREYLRRRGGDV